MINVAGHFCSHIGTVSKALPAAMSQVHRRHMRTRFIDIILKPGKALEFLFHKLIMIQCRRLLSFLESPANIFCTKNIIYQLLSEIRITVISLCFDTKFKLVVDTTISICRLNLIQKHLNKWLIFKKNALGTSVKIFLFRKSQTSSDANLQRICTPK